MISNVTCNLLLLTWKTETIQIIFDFNDLNFVDFSCDVRKGWKLFDIDNNFAIWNLLSGDKFANRNWSNGWINGNVKKLLDANNNWTKQMSWFIIHGYTSNYNRHAMSENSIPNLNSRFTTWNFVFQYKIKFETFILTLDRT